MDLGQKAASGRVYVHPGFVSDVTTLRCLIDARTLGPVMRHGHASRSPLRSNGTRSFTALLPTAGRIDDATVFPVQVFKALWKMHAMFLPLDLLDDGNCGDPNDHVFDLAFVHFCARQAQRDGTKQRVFSLSVVWYPSLAFHFHDRSIWNSGWTCRVLRPYKDFSSVSSLEERSDSNQMSVSVQNR